MKMLSGWASIFPTSVISQWVEGIVRSRWRRIKTISTISNQPMGGGNCQVQMEKNKNYLYYQ